MMMCTKAGTKYVLVRAIKSMMAVRTAKNPEEER
jgi:hypothetical protein